MRVLKRKNKKSGKREKSSKFPVLETKKREICDFKRKNTEKCGKFSMFEEKMRKI